MVIGLIFPLCSEGIKGGFFLSLESKQALCLNQEKMLAARVDHHNSGSAKVKQPILYKTEQQRCGIGTEHHSYTQWCSGMAPKGAIASVTTGPVPLIASIKCHCNLCQDAGKMYYFIFQHICHCKASK